MHRVYSHDQKMTGIPVDEAQAGTRKPLKNLPESIGRRLVSQLPLL